MARIGRIVLAVGFLFLLHPHTAREQTESVISQNNIETKPTEPIPPILAAIAQCESGGRQYNDDGSVVTGKINSHDRGKFQINETYNLAAAQSLGMDIYTLQGNTAYALYLYDHEGTTPWNASRKCWA